MVTLGSLWLPIVLSAVIVFLASWLMHMVLRHHRTDWGKLPDEAAFRDAMRRLNVPPGQYVVPHCVAPKEMGTPEFKKKLDEGPVGLFVFWPNGPFKMGKSMVLSFLFNVVVAFLVAYLAGRTLGMGAEYLAVFRVVGTVTIMAYTVALFWEPIWHGRSWSWAMKSAFDGVVYGLLTAGVFGWLWPR